MNNTAPIWMGIAAIAGLVGIVGTSVAYVVYGFPISSAVFVGVIAAAVAAIALAIGWREPNTKRDTVSDPDRVADDVPAAEPAPATEVAAAVRDAPVGEKAVVEREAVAEYEGAAEPQAAPKPKAKPKPAAAAAGSPPAAAAARPTPAALGATPAADPAPAVPSASEHGKPEFLTAPRNEKPDNLKLIKGIGPKLETTLHAMGIFHFEQIAAWGPAELAWMDDNLEGFKGRPSRDNWVIQAKALIV